MRNVAVVQWSRLGDVLQTRGLLRALQRSDPSVRVTFFADARYAEIVRRLPEQPDFCPVNLSDLTGAARHNSSQTEFLQRASVLLRAYDGVRFDEAYVLTRSLAAALFADMLRPGQTRGYCLHEGRLIAPPQIQWVEERCAAGLPAAVHLSDAWATLAKCNGVPEWPPFLNRNEPNAMRERSPCGRLAFLCDAGETYRGIPESWLAGLARRILVESQNRVVLLGQTVSAPNGELFRLVKSAGERVSDLRGRTSLADLCNQLAGSDLIVGPDTGGLHLAAALGVPVLGIYFGGAAAMHTGPYHPRALVVENPPWSDDASESVAQLILAVLARGDVAEAARKCAVLTPRLDNLGLVFAASDAPALLCELISAREEFFRRFSESASAQANITVRGARMNDLAVIVPECGATSYTDELLPDLERELNGEGEIILVCSGESASRPNATFPKNVRCLRVSEPLTFAQACNRGARESNKKWLLFLNNDTHLSAGSLQVLLNEADANTLLSPLIRYPDGLIQNAGVYLEDGQVIEIAHGLCEVEEPRPPDAVSAVALLMSRAAFERLKGFDESFRNGYEDLDLCLRAGESGCAVRVNPSVTIEHFRGSSQGRFDHDSSNRALFMDKWRARLSRASRPPISPVRGVAVPEVVIVTDEPPEAAGSLLRWIWPLTRCGLERDRDYLYLCASQDAASADEVIRCISAACTLVVFRPLGDAALRHAVNDCAARGNARLWVDSDDLFLGRFGGASPRAQAWNSVERGFRDLLRRADVITASTTALQEELQLCGFRAVLLETKPSAHLLVGDVSLRRSEQKFVIGFFGTPSHLIDLGNILPALETVLERYPHVWFYWWGCRPGDLAYHPRVRQGGPAVTEYESHLWRLHRFHLDAAVVPLLDSPYARAKSPVKFFEYALAGVPAVYSPRAPYINIVRAGETGLLADDSTAEWVQALETLLTNAPLRERIATQAQRQMRERLKDPNADDIFKRILMDVLNRKVGVATQARSAECPA